MDDRKETMKVDEGVKGVRTVVVNYPGNSHTKKREVKEKKEEPEKRVKKGNQRACSKTKKTFLKPIPF